MVASDRDVEDLPHSTSQGEKKIIPSAALCEWIADMFFWAGVGGVKPFCIIQSDLSQFDVDDFEEEARGLFGKGQTHRVASYKLQVFKGAADIKLELWFRDKKRSEEKSIKVNWNHDLARDEVY